MYEPVDFNVSVHLSADRLDTLLSGIFVELARQGDPSLLPTRTGAKRRILDSRTIPSGFLRLHLQWSIVEDTSMISSSECNPER